MNDIMQQILDKIKEYDKILIFRHIRPDGDCVGASKGLQRILQLTYPEKKILLQNCDFSEYLAFLGEEDKLIPKESYNDALAIVLDTTKDRVSNKDYALCKEVIKIDHHIDNNPYGDISWTEESRSSVCEMIALFYSTFKDQLKIDKYAATCLFTGMVTDTGRFKYSEVTGETLRLAGMLADFDIDLDRIYAHLYLDSFEYMKFKAYVYKKIKMTKHGVCYLDVNKSMCKKFNIGYEEASNAVSFMERIKGSIIWIAFIENGDGSIRVRLRSRFVEVDKLANRYRGGGHACAAGATIYNGKEYKNLLLDADQLIKEYKENNNDWL